MPSNTFLTTLTSPTSYAVVDPRGQYIYTLDSSGWTITQWSVDHVFNQQILVNPVAAVLLQGCDLLVPHTGRHLICWSFVGSNPCVAIYSVALISGNLTYVNEVCLVGSNGSIILADDKNTTVIVGVDNEQHMFLSLSNGRRVCSSWWRQSR